MPRDMRTFVAFRVRDDIRRRLFREAERLRSLESDLRPVAEQDLHVTLQFLGGTPDHDVHLVSRALEEVGARHAPIEVGYAGLGAFPEPSRARVVWAGVQDLELDAEGRAAGALEALVTDIGRALGRLGFPPERRRFHPHVTLGRLRRRPDPALVEALEAAQRDPEGDPEGATGWGEEIVSEVKLIVSDPSQKPYHYIDLTTVYLEGEARDEAPDG